MQKFKNSIFQKKNICPIKAATFQNCKNIEKIVFKKGQDILPSFQRNLKDKIKFEKTLDDLIEENTSFKQINKLYNDLER